MSAKPGAIVGAALLGYAAECGWLEGPLAVTVNMDRARGHLRVLTGDDFLVGGLDRPTAVAWALELVRQMGATVPEPDATRTLLGEAYDALQRELLAVGTR